MRKNLRIIVLTKQIFLYTDVCVSSHLYSLKDYFTWLDLRCDGQRTMPFLVLSFLRIRERLDNINQLLLRGKQRPALSMTINVSKIYRKRKDRIYGLIIQYKDCSMQRLHKSHAVGLGGVTAFRNCPKQLSVFLYLLLQD